MPCFDDFRVISRSVKPRAKTPPKERFCTSPFAASRWKPAALFEQSVAEAGDGRLRTNGEDRLKIRGAANDDHLANGFVFGFKIDLPEFVPAGEMHVGLFIRSQPKGGRRCFRRGLRGGAHREEKSQEGTENSFHNWGR